MSNDTMIATITIPASVKTVSTYLRIHDSLRHRRDRHYDVAKVDHAHNLHDPTSPSTTESVYRLITEQVRVAIGDAR